QLAPLTPTERPLRVMVVGAGPAGLEAARVAALRGHRVDVYEKGAEIGGQTLLAQRAPGRLEIGEIARYYSVQLRRLEVALHLQTEVTPELVAGEDPDVVLVATGSVPYQADIRAVEGAHVVDARDVLGGEASPGRRVVVVAGEAHIQALSTADFLADRGHEVEVVTRAIYAGSQLEAGTREAVYRRLLENGATITPLTRVRAVRGRTVEVSNELTEAGRTIEDVDTVVLAFGGRSDDRLAAAHEGGGREVRVIGDAFAPRRLMDAIYEGTLAGRQI
ncbi:MAG: FAD-dependent oxidoreductase, partial [Dehalococcoidia bacterium]